MSDSTPIAAGDTSAWFAATDQGLITSAPADVPCGACTACCRSAQFILVTADEAGALAAIPSEVLFPAPGRPGDYVMGHDEAGHCPMFVDGACSIYAARPRACRTYDCRVFAAAEVFPDAPASREVASRSRRWRFDENNPQAAGALKATRAAARYLVRHRQALVEVLRDQPLAVALAAIQVRHLFAGGDEPPLDTVRAALRP